MSIKGQLQHVETNDWGYVRIKVSGTFYGADKKGAVSVAVGDLVEFEAYQKAGTNGKSYATFKYTSLVKVEGAVPQPSGNATNVAGSTKGAGAQAGGGKDTYWAEKEANDKAKEPRISYHAAYERALGLTDLAIRNGAFDALAKAKPTTRLEILQAFVAEQADHIMGLVYSAKVPSAEAAVAAGAEPEASEEQEKQESWA